METLIIFLLPFAMFGFYRFSKWWMVMLWQKKTDIYNSEDDWFFILPTLFAILWGLTTIFHGNDIFARQYIVQYAFELLFGPFSFILGTVRLFGFGNTRIGKKIGCFPPSDSRHRY